VASRAIRPPSSLAMFGLLACALVAIAATDTANLDFRPQPLGSGILEALRNEDQVELIVLLRQQAQLVQAYAIADRLARGQSACQALREVADRAQVTLRAELEACGVSYYRFSIVNAIRVTADQEFAA
jgi:hypothetical protein